MTQTLHMVRSLIVPFQLVPSQNKSKSNAQDQTWALLFWYNYTMATKVYEVDRVTLMDGTSVELKPLKIKYLRDFMEYFDIIKYAKNDEDSIKILSHCAFIALKSQYSIMSNIEELEDSVNLPTIYQILDITAGIRVNPKKEESVKEQAEDSKSSTWDNLDLAELEAEVFLLGIWKDYEQLELALSMPELTATLKSKRDLDYQEKKFLAAIQGVDLDKQSGKDKTNAWEEMKARVFSGGQTSDPNDITSFQGVKAQQNGFGIGMGIGYQDLRKK